MELSIKVYRTEYEAPPSRTRRSVPDGMLTGEIVLKIDEVKLARLLGPRALHNKQHRTTLAGGAIVAHAVNLRRTPEGT